MREDASISSIRYAGFERRSRKNGSYEIVRVGSGDLAQEGVDGKLVPGGLREAPLAQKLRDLL